MLGLKIFFAAAFGALMGTIIGLWISENSIWVAIVGFIVGGFTGYLSYEFKTVVKAVCASWQMVSSREKVSRSREIFRLMMSGLILYVIYLSCIFMAFESFILSLSFLLGDIRNFYDDSFDLFFAIIISAYVACLILLRTKITAYKDRRFAINILLKANPFAVYLYWPLWALWWVATHLSSIGKVIWNALGGIWKFFTRIYITIHSDVRLILFVDGGTGAVIGYYFASPIIGALAGGILGVVNYYIVAHLLLGLTPKGTKTQ